MAKAIASNYDHEAQRIDSLLPVGPRVALLGSSDFWHPESERTCEELGLLLAGIAGLVLITGGVEGIGEAVGRSFFKARHNIRQESCVYHVLPAGEEQWDYGHTLCAGKDMTERREILGRICRLYLMVEGGPGAEHEANIAIAHHASVIPVGRSGGRAAAPYASRRRPECVDAATWEVLGSNASTPHETASAAVRAVRACLEKTIAAKQESPACGNSKDARSP